MPYRPPVFTNLEPEQKAKVHSWTDFKFHRKSANLLTGSQKHDKRGVRALDLRVAYLCSLGVHAAAPVVFIAASVLLMLLFGMDWFDMFSKHTPQKADLVFVLTPPHTPEQKPINPNTIYRAHQNTRASGEHDPTREINLESARPQTPQKPQEAARPAPPVQQKAAPAQKPVKAAIQRPASTQPSIRTAPVLASVPATSPSMPVPAQSDIQAEIPNAGPGNKSGPPAVDAVRDPDFGPYMKELQRRIRMSWRPPRGNESKKIVVVFTVRRDGSLDTIKIVKSSGEHVADQAAIVAVQQVFPFRPLPAEFDENDIDIEFTFDYNVFGDKNWPSSQAKNS